MARRNSGQTQAPPAETTEAAPTTETTTTEGTAPEVNLDAFKTAVETAVAERDESTGVLPEAVFGPVNEAYRALDGQKAKNAAKSFLEDQMKQGMADMQWDWARAHVLIKDQLSAGKSTSEKAPADPKAALVNKIASLSLAESITRSNLPEGIDLAEVETAAAELAESLGEQVESYGTWLTTEPAEGEDKADAPEVSAVVRAAFKLAQGKASGGGRTSGGSGVRRDVGKHITEAFASVNSGDFLSVAKIANFSSTEYGDDSPSQGAVSARLFPTSGKCTVEGITLVDKTSDHPRGASKN